MHQPSLVWAGAADFREPTTEMSLSFRNYRSETLTHSHDDFHQIIISHHGVLDLDIDGVGGEVRGRQIAFVPAGAKHAYRAQGMNRFLVIDLDAGLAKNAGLEQLWQKAGGSAYLSIAQDIRFGDLEKLSSASVQAPQVKPDHVQAGFGTTSRASIPMAGNLVGQDMLPFLSDLLCAAGQRQKAGSFSHLADADAGGIPPRLARVMEWAAARLGEPVNVAQMARIAALSESALFAAFERHVGCSPMRWLVALRLDQGRDWLSDQANCDSIGDIASQAGFQDQAAFSRAFSRRFNVSPAQYRKQCRAG